MKIFTGKKYNKKNIWENSTKKKSTGKKVKEKKREKSKYEKKL